MVGVGYDNAYTVKRCQHIGFSIWRNLKNIIRYKDTFVEASSRQKDFAELASALSGSGEMGTLPRPLFDCERIILSA